MRKISKPHLYPQVCQPFSQRSYLFKFVDLPDKEIPIASGNLGVCNMDHVLWEKAVRTEVVGRGGGVGRCRVVMKKRAT